MWCGGCCVAPSSPPPPRHITRSAVCCPPCTHSLWEQQTSINHDISVLHTDKHTPTSIQYMPIRSNTHAVHAHLAAYTHSLWEQQASVNHDVSVLDPNKHTVHADLAQPSDGQHTQWGPSGGRRPWTQHSIAQHNTAHDGTAHHRVAFF